MPPIRPPVPPWVPLPSPWPRPCCVPSPGSRRALTSPRNDRWAAWDDGEKMKFLYFFRCDMVLILLFFICCIYHVFLIWFIYIILYVYMLFYWVFSVLRCVLSVVRLLLDVSKAIGSTIPNFTIFDRYEPSKYLQLMTFVC